MSFDCSYEHKLELPHLPEMVFSKNCLTLTHTNGATIEFNPLDALARVENGKSSIHVACAEEWKSTRAGSANLEEVRPFDWSFTTDYQGTFNEKIRCEDTDEKLDIFKLMKKEKILFYQDLSLFEDELHDHGIACCSVKIVSSINLFHSIFYLSYFVHLKHDVISVIWTVLSCSRLKKQEIFMSKNFVSKNFHFQRVMPSGFFILLTYFLRVDGVLIRMNGTRFHYETGNDYMLKEFTTREAKFETIKHVSII